YPGTNAGETVQITNGPIVSGTQTIQINSGLNPTFELINFANKTNVTFQAGTGSDTITVNFTTLAAGLIALNVLGRLGTNTRVGPDANNIWSLTGTDHGFMSAQPVTFDAFQNLTGGALRDVFQFAVGSLIDGTIKGGGANNWLDYSALPGPLTI